MGWFSWRRGTLVLLSVAGVWLLTGCDPPVDHVVNTTVDGVDAVPGDGVCETDTDGECTLRAAIMEANAKPNHDRVVLADGASYVLDVAGIDEDAAATGDLDVSTKVTVAGNGATIDADNIDRVLQVLAGGRLTLADVHVTGGTAPHGGGLLNQGTATARDTTFSNNTADSTGGAIRNSATATAMTLERVTLTDNTAPTGAALVVLADVTVHGSSMTDNHATNAAGAVRVGAGVQFTVTDSTFAGNESATIGGAIDNRGSTIAINTTFSGNTAGRGGAIATYDELVLAYSTVVGNEAQPGRGAGLSIETGTAEVQSSIIADNVGATDCNGVPTSLGANLDSDGSCLPVPAAGDQPGADPRLGPLTDNGGATPTHLPALTSPALDTAAPVDGACPAVGLPLTLDQRGQPRPAGTGCDTGAVEVPPLGDITVNTGSDGTDAAPGDGLCATATGSCTLRAAIDEANATRAPDTITIAALPRLTIAGRYEDANASGDLDVTATLTIVGAGPGATINGNQIDRVIHHHAGTLTLERLTIRRGFVEEPRDEYDTPDSLGGGIHAAAPIVLREAVVTDNRGASVSSDFWGPITSYGGGIYATDDLSVTDSTLSANESTDGSAVYLAAGAEGTLTRTSVSGNRSVRHGDEGPNVSGSAVRSLGPLTLTTVGVSDTQGGGVSASAGLTAHGVRASGNDGTAIGVDGGTAELADLRIGSYWSGNHHGLSFYGATSATVRDAIIMHNRGIGLLTGAHGTTEVTNAVLYSNDLGGVDAGPSSPVELTATSIYANGGLAGIRGGAWVTLEATAVEQSGPDCSGAVTTRGYNVSNDTSCGLTDPSDLQNAASGMFDDETDEIILLATGAVIDRIPIGTPGLCDGSLPTDARGVPRPSGVGCDVGAVEYAQPGDLVVDTALDGPDQTPGDSLCATASGGCTLRAAVDEANATAAPDTIVIAPGIDPVLALPGVREDSNASGDLDITADLTIEGNGATIDGNQIDRVLHHRAGALVVEDVTVTNGHLTYDEIFDDLEWTEMGYGVGIRADAPLTVRHSMISHNVGASSSGCQWQCTTNSLGGGIYAADALTLEHTTIEHNASSNGGGLYVRRSPGVNLSDVVVRDNRTYRVDDDDDTVIENIGTTVYLFNTPLTAARTSVIDNGGSGLSDLSWSDGDGPAVDTTISIEHSRFEGNVGIGLEVRPGSANPGLIGTATIEDTSIRGNTGAALRASGSTDLRSSLLHGNGSGLTSGSCHALSVKSSTIADNGTGGVAQISSCGTLALKSTTIRGVGRLLNSANATVAASSFESDGAGGVPACNTPVLSSHGWNVASDTSCGLTATGDLQGVDPMLGPLADNGGPTWSMLPLAGSPLIDRIPIGTAGLCDGTLPTDQRGFPRPVGAGCDVGAVEVGP